MDALCCQQVADGNGGLHHGADCQDRTVLPILQDFPTSGDKSIRIGVSAAQIDAGASIADGTGGVMLLGPAKHCAQFADVAGSQDGHAGNRQQRGEIPDAVMRFAVLTHQTSTVQQQGDRQAGHADIMDHLVKAALEEGGVHRKIGLHTSGSKTCCHGDSVLLRNADVQHALREAFLEMVQAGAAGHGSRDGHDAGIIGSHIGQCFRHDRAIGRQGGFLAAVAGLDIERRSSVEDLRLLFRFVISVTLLGQDVNDHGLLQLFNILQGLDEAWQIMTVDGAIIAETKGIEETLLLLVDKESFDRVLHPLHAPCNRLTDDRNVLKTAADDRFCVLPAAGCTQVGQVPAEGAHVAGNGHLVIIENDDHAGFGIARVIQRFVAHAAGHCAVTHQGNHLMGLPFQITGAGHAQGSRKRCRSMASLEGVVFALAALGKAGQAAISAQGMETVIAASQQLMDIALVADVEDQLVRRHIEDAVQCQGQFDNAKIRRQMAAVLGYRGHQFRADLPRKIVQFVNR